MEVKKAIKRIVALGVGASMLGATVLGAMAACDLSKYPEPFVMDGEFNGLLVVGDTSTAADTLGVADVFGSLQFANKVAGDGDVTTSSIVTVSEGYKVERSGDKLNLFDDIRDIKDTPLDDAEIPTVLKEGTYDDSEGKTDNEETYTQQLSFMAGTASYTYDHDDDGDELVGPYLRFDKGEIIYEYVLEFDDAVDFDDDTTYSLADDLESTKLELMGQVYTVTDSDFSAAEVLTSLTLLAGETVIWLTEGDKITKLLNGVEHEIYVVDVSENEDSCGVSVDGQVVWIDKDKTETVNGIEIGVTDAISVHTATQDTDVCEINIGAEELLLENGKKVKMSGSEIDGSKVYVNGTANNWAGLTVQFDPDDEENLPPGSEWVDPVFGKWKLKFANEVKTTETITWEASGEDATLSFLNADGDEVQIGFRGNDSDNEVYLGTDLDEQLIVEGMSLVYDCPGTAGTDEDCEGVKLLLVDSGEVPHIVEIDDVNLDEESIDFYDHTAKKSYDDVDYVNGTTTSISLGSLGTYTLNFSGTGKLNANDDNLQLDALPETKYGAQIEIVAGKGYTVNTTGWSLIEDDDEANQYNWTFTANWDDTDKEIDFVTTPTFTAIGVNADEKTASGIDESDSNDDDEYWATEWGTIAKIDVDDNHKVELWYPKEQTYANVFIAPISAMITAVGGGDVATPVRIDTGAVIFAKEVPSGDHNLILVGGPCVNSKAAEVMGNPEDCTAGFEEGKAMIKCFEDGDSVAVLVAGYSGRDTRAAARYLSNYADHQDKFLKATDEISLSVTSLDSVTATIPTAE